MTACVGLGGGPQAAEVCFFYVLAHSWPSLAQLTTLTLSTFGEGSLQKSICFTIGALR